MPGKREKLLAVCILLSMWQMPLCMAAEELATAASPGGETEVAYVLNYRNLMPKYVLILFPGGYGIVDPHMQDGKLVYKARGNFLMRARKHFVDNEFVTVATNSTPLASRIQILIDHLNRRFPAAQIYLVGTSKGTYDTLELAEYLSDKIAGEIHTSSMQRISFLNAKKYRNRHLIVHHRDDACHVTPFSSARAGHDKYGTELLVMEGGVSVGDDCEAYSHHGYNGIEKETAEAIKQWVRQPG